jgi:transcriptional regulator with XRE-family HTH domain
MKTLGEKLRELRENSALLLREVAAKLEVDPSLLSKIERGDKRATWEQVVMVYQTDDGLFHLTSPAKFIELREPSIAFPPPKPGKIPQD